MQTRLLEIVRSFDRHPQESARLLRRLFDVQPEQFCTAALALLQGNEEFTRGNRYVITMLASRNRLPQLLCTPSLNLERAIRIARTALETDSLVDTRLAEHLAQSASGEEHALSEQDENRLVEIICAISRGHRILPVLIRLGTHPNVHVRAKSVRLTCQLNQNLNYVKKRLNDANERVRANSIEALWGTEVEGSRDVLWNAVGDPDNRVVGNALLALYQFGEVKAIDEIAVRSRAPEESHRLTSAWIMGQTGDGRFLPELEHLLEDPSPQVRARARQSGDAIAQLCERLRSAPPLRVYLTNAAPPEEGSRTRRICLAVRSPDGGDCRSIVPTRCVLWEGAGRIDAYEIQRLPLPNVLEVAFVFPGAGVAGEPLLDAARRALSACSRFKRPRDSWETIWYGRPVVAVGFNPSELSLAGATGDQVRFGVGKTSPAASNPSHEDTPGLVRAIERLMGASPSARESRQIIVMTPRAMWGERVSHLENRARETHTVLHGIAMEAMPPFEELCLQTGGTFSIAVNEEQAPTLIERAYLAALPQFEIAYETQPESEIPAGGVREIKLQVYTDDAMGEGYWPNGR